ncbi:uncharacterized protein HaLaN_06734, partial [Haematococcus lacustris]
GCEDGSGVGAGCKCSNEERSCSLRCARQLNFPRPHIKKTRMRQGITANYTSGGRGVPAALGGSPQARVSASSLAIRLWKMATLVPNHQPCPSRAITLDLKSATIDGLPGNGRLPLYSYHVAKPSRLGQASWTREPWTTTWPRADCLAASCSEDSESCRSDSGTDPSDQDSVYVVPQCLSCGSHECSLPARSSCSAQQIIQPRLTSCSVLDNVLSSLWEDCGSRRLFRYDVTACPSRVIPGRWGFVAQLNEGRASKKRPTEIVVDQVCQPFDPAKFHFGKALPSEVLLQFESSGTVDESADSYAPPSRLTPAAYVKASFLDSWQGGMQPSSSCNSLADSTEESDCGAVVPSAATSLGCNSQDSFTPQAREPATLPLLFDSAPVTPSSNLVLINVSPIEYGHVLLVPRTLQHLPQQLKADLVLTALHFAHEAGNPHFNVGYNSLGAYATINHLHFQVCVLAWQLTAFHTPCYPAAKAQCTDTLRVMSVVILTYHVRKASVAVIDSVCCYLCPHSCLTHISLATAFPVSQQAASSCQLLVQAHQAAQLQSRSPPSWTVSSALQWNMSAGHDARKQHGTMLGVGGLFLTADPVRGFVIEAVEPSSAVLNTNAMTAFGALDTNASQAARQLAALPQLAAVVGQAAEALQASNVPFNMLITEKGARVFLWPQCYAERQAAKEVEEELLATGVNPAVFEVAGHMVLKRAEDYQGMQEDLATRLLSAVSLPADRFQAVADLCFRQPWHQPTQLPASCEELHLLGLRRAKGDQLTAGSPSCKRQRGNE